MGISVSAGTAVILIGVFLMLGVIVPGALNAHELVTTAEEERQQHHVNQQQTDINIQSITTDNDTMEVNATNNGTTSLSLAETSVVVDNTHRTIEHTAIDNISTDLWLPDETATFEVAGTGEEHLVLVTEHGITDRASLEDEA